MTDDELRQYLKPKHGPMSIVLSVAVAAVTILGAAAGLGKWVFEAPTKQDYTGLDTRTKTIELDHGILKAQVDGIRVDVSKLDIQLDKLNGKTDKLLERRR